MSDYRVIYNEDFMELFYKLQQPIVPDDVERMVDEAAEGGADVLLINVNAQKTNYPSRAWEPFWDGYQPGKLDFFGRIKEETALDFDRVLGQMKRLADGGCDYLSRSLERCREKGILPGVSVRMNDIHYVTWPETRMISSFYRDNPHYRLPPAGFRCHNGALDYRFEEVRRYYLALIEELAGGYDFEVMELDFSRTAAYFPDPATAADRDVMTDFLRQTRSLLQGCGRPLSLLARLPAAPALAVEMGFDAAAWADEGLLQGLVISAYRNTQWHPDIAGYRRLVGRKMALYAATEVEIDRREGLLPRLLPNSPPFLRGFAAGCLAAGADGVELFNFFCARPVYKQEFRAICGGAEAGRLAFEALADMGSLERLRSLPRSHAVMSGWSCSGCNGTTQLPLTLQTGQARLLEMPLAEGSEGLRTEAEAVFRSEADIRPEHLRLDINHLPAGAPVRIGRLAEDEGCMTAVFDLPAAAISDGINRLIVRNEGPDIDLVSLEIHFR